jgi:hypothetical protein
MVSLLPGSGTEDPKLGLRIVLGSIESGPLVREALSGALQTKPGSVFWLSPTSGDLELVFPIGTGVIGDLSLVFKHNLKLARSWRIATATPEQPAEAAKPSRAGNKKTKSRGGGRRKQSGHSDASHDAKTADPDMVAEVAETAVEATGAEAARPAPRRRSRKSATDMANAAIHQGSLLEPETKTPASVAPGGNAGEATGTHQESRKI